jgi:hypothetical protein
MKRKHWRRLGIGFLVLCAAGLIVAAILDPTCFVLSVVTWQPYHNGKSASYWREVLRADGQAGRVSDETLRAMGSRRLLEDSAVPVLLVCLRDPDRNVRWPAACILRKGVVQSKAKEIVPGLRAAMHDPDPEVRFQAVQALGACESGAIDALPEIVELAHGDPDDSATFWADVALWRLHAVRAAREDGWAPFTSKEWRFTATFPPGVEETMIEGPRPSGSIFTHAFQAHHYPMFCTVAVAEEPPEMVDWWSDDNSFVYLCATTPWAVGGKLVVHHY